MNATSLTGRIAVLGGTGFLGRTLCEHLMREAASGLAIVVPTRRAPHANDVKPLPAVEVRVADVHDDRALTRVVAGCSAVVNLVAILQGRDRDFEKVHVALPRRLAAACKATGVRRVVHVSAIGAAPDAPSMYLRSKAGGEAALREPALEVTVLRPSIIFGAGDRFLNLFAQLQAVLPVLPLAGADARFQPVWIADVAQAIVECLRRRETIGRTIEAVGPEVFTLEALVRLAGRWSGRERPIVRLPAALAGLQAWLMESLPGEPMMSRDNLASMRVPNVASGRLPGLDMLGIAPASLASVAPGYLGRSDGRTRLDLLRAFARR